jgi:ABC-type nickel/cobalt efflux system permease component RcnA
VVISSYLVANEVQLRRGVVIAFVSAFLQAVVAVAVIAVLAVILNMTSMAIDRTAKFFEAGSFALVAALGVYLLARKGRAAWAVFSGGDVHAHHNHHHHARDPLPPCGGETQRGEGHGMGALEDERRALHVTPLPDPSPQGGRGLGAAAAVLSVGIRPCTGALVVLVFALSQGIFWAGVASTFVMALGTALTVAVLAAIAVGAKDLAGRLSQGDGERAERVMVGLELLAALFITAMGVSLFLGAIYA